MKSVVKSLTHLLSAGLILPAALATASVVETATEIHLSADLDGDGRADMVVIDREGGGFRAAYQTAPGVWSWSEPRATGLAGISGAAVGRWFTTASEGFALAAPDANRVRIVRAADPLAPADLTVLSSAAALGPAAVAAPDIGGGGNTAHSDLWLGFVENGAPDPFAHGTLRHNGSDFNPITTSTVAVRPDFVRTVPLKEGGVPLVVFLGTQPGESAQFTALDYSSGSAVVAAQTALFENSRWISGKLGGGADHHLLSWQPGNLLFRARTLSEGPPNSFSIGAPEVFFIDTAIGQLHIAGSDAGARLIVVSPDGSEVGIYDFNGIDAPDLEQTVEPAPGDKINAILPLASGGFQLMSGPADSAFTTAATRFVSDPDGFFDPEPTVSLPELRPAGLRGNVIAYSGEIFVDPAAVPLARYGAAEWSSSAALAGDQLSVIRERFQGSAQGLGADQLVALGTVASGTTFALTNQMRDNISVHSFDAADGAIGIDVAITPQPGPQTSAVSVRLNATSPIAPVFYRLNNGAWENWTGTPVYIGETTEIAFFARHPITNEPTPIRRATYTFATPPHLLDSDGDGVPDFVERFFGLDPFGGPDTDGDGYSDLNEILLDNLAEFDPNDANKKPDSNQRLEENIAFRLQVAPLAFDGATQIRATPQPGSRLEVHSLDGTLLGGTGAAPLTAPGISGPGLNLSAVVADDRLDLVSVLTEAVFPIQTPDPDKDRGREVAVFLPIPKTTLPEVNYTPGGGTLAQEVAAWIAAAKAARDNVERPLVARNYTEIDTLSALVLEWKLEQIFLQRGLPGLASGRLTLFGGRPGDAARFAPSAQELVDLRLRASPTLPGYRIEELFAEVSDAIANEPAYATARAAATAIYRVSSANANANPPGTYLPPFDVLRAFVRGEPLPEPYASEVLIANKNLEAAQAALVSLRDDLAPRPVGTFLLRVEPDSFTGPCRGLTDLDTADTVHLFAVPGQPYQGTDGFDLIPDTEVLVTAYTDLESFCGTAVEVIDLSILSFPPVAFIDGDDNLLPDEWEWALLLGLGNDPFDDDDGDGISNLQEYLDGTDPLDALSKDGGAVDLSPPPINIFGYDIDGLALVWEYPPAYADAVLWVLETSTDLADWSIHPSALVQETEPGLFSILLPNEVELNPKAFYRIRMTLKP